MVWLKTTIHSDTAQQEHVTLGWSREIFVFVNGQLIFADKNLYQPPEARKAPDGRLSLDNGSLMLPLRAGDNELVVAVLDNFYGWGTKDAPRRCEGSDSHRTIVETLRVHSGKQWEAFGHDIRDARNRSTPRRLDDEQPAGPFPARGAAVEHLGLLFALPALSASNWSPRCSARLRCGGHGGWSLRSSSGWMRAFP